MGYQRIDPHDVRTTRILRAGNGYSAAVMLVEYAGLSAVLKDYSSAGFLFRNMIGRYLTRREARAYSRLSHISGVPRFHGRVGRAGLLIDHTQGVNLTSVSERSLGRHFFDEIEKILSSFVACRLVHLDLKNNIMVTDKEQPVILDFQTAVLVPPWSGPFGSWILLLALMHYKREVLRLRMCYGLTPLSCEELAVTRKKVPFENLWRVSVRCYRWTTSLIVLIVTQTRTKVR